MNLDFVSFLQNVLAGVLKFATSVLTLLFSPLIRAAQAVDFVTPILNDLISEISKNTDSALVFAISVVDDFLDLQFFAQIIAAIVSFLGAFLAYKLVTLLIRTVFSWLKIDSPLSGEKE